jgi:transposase
MRGEQRRSDGLFSYIRLEERIAPDHPLRAILVLVNEVLAALSGRFEELYSHTGRPSIPPEYLLRATLLQAFFTVRSERQLMEQINYNLLFRWFVGLSIDDAVWDATVFTKNRDRLLEADVAREFLSNLLSLPKVKRLLSSDHFSVDGTLLKAWASMKSFQPKDGSGDPPTGGRNGERNFHREKRSNETHESTTDPDAKLYRKGDGQESRLCYMGHVLMENRNGLAVAGDVTQATGTAEREAALTLIDNHRPAGQRITLGADKAYDVVEFVEALRKLPSDAPHRDQRSCHQDGQDSQDRSRRSHHPTSRLRDQPGHPQTDRGNLRLDQSDRRIGAGQSPRARQGASRLHLRNPGLQSRANTQASGGHMRRGAKSALIGKWRIIEMGLWDNDYLDMVEAAYIQFKANGLGQFKFGCVVGGLDCTFFADAADFTWQGSDEMDPVSGDGWAELDHDGTINGEISFHLGDESTFKARKW